MSPASAGLDHAIVGVRDLEAARASYLSLGFTLSPRGSHIGWSTANYCIMFDADYVELLGIAGSGGESAGLDRFLVRREGLMGLALKSLDAAAATAVLRAAGMDTSAPKELARRLELAEGTVLPRFSLVDAPAGIAPGFKVFLCQHLTPALLRRPEWLRHANGARGIAGVILVVPEPAALAPGYRALFGATAIGAAAADTLLVQPATGARLAFLRAAPGTDSALDASGVTLAGMEIAVADLGATARCLEAGGVRFRRGADRIDVPAHFAAGCPLAFLLA